MANLCKSLLISFLSLSKNYIARRFLFVVLFVFVNATAYNQELDSIRSLKLIFEPIQEVTVDQVGDAEQLGVLGSLPANIDLKVKAEIEVTDTSNLNKIYIKLGTKPDSEDLINTIVDIQSAIVNTPEKFFINEHIIVVELGTFPKPSFISCDVYLENKEAQNSPSINYKSY